MCDGLPSVVEQDLSRAGRFHQGYGDRVRLIMRRDLDVATRSHAIVDCLPNSGLDIGYID
jgi:hypothetical protein